MGSFKKITEQESKYNNLEKMPLKSILTCINQEDQSVPHAVEKAIEAIHVVVEQVVKTFKQGGRLFYIGAGTSGRLGILDASECPPTFGVDPNMVIGIIAGGPTAIQNAVENAEDDTLQGWKDLQEHHISNLDMVIGIAASGTTPYVINAIKQARMHQIKTASMSCNPNSPLSQCADFPIEVIVGPEFVTGSSRMKAGTAQKLVLNMITTASMIQLGRIQDNRMVDMKMTNAKLIKRGAEILVDQLKIDLEQAHDLLATHKNVRKSIEYYKTHNHA